MAAMLYIPFPLDKKGLAMKNNSNHYNPDRVSSSALICLSQIKLLCLVALGWID